MTEFTNQSTEELAQFIKSERRSHELIRWVRGEPTTVTVIGIGTGNQGAVIANSLEGARKYLDKNPEFFFYIAKCESGVSDDVDDFTSEASGREGSRRSELNVMSDNPSKDSSVQSGEHTAIARHSFVVKEQRRVGSGYAWIHLGEFRSAGVIDDLSFQLKLGRKRSSDGSSKIALRVEHLAPRSQKVGTFYIVSDSIDSCIRSIAFYPNLPYKILKQQLQKLHFD